MHLCRDVVGVFYARSFIANEFFEVIECGRFLNVGDPFVLHDQLVFVGQIVNIVLVVLELVNHFLFHLASHRRPG